MKKRHYRSVPVAWLGGEILVSIDVCNWTENHSICTWLHVTVFSMRKFM